MLTPAETAVLRVLRRLLAAAVRRRDEATGEIEEAEGLIRSVQRKCAAGNPRHCDLIGRAGCNCPDCGYGGE